MSVPVCFWCDVPRRLVDYRRLRFHEVRLMWECPACGDREDEIAVDEWEREDL